VTYRLDLVDERTGKVVMAWSRLPRRHVERLKALINSRLLPLAGAVAQARQAFAELERKLVGPGPARRRRQ